ncbi:hypothetical protein CEE44_02295 [Candidatus Woesearchaeota archaeon B3_Woes]|nr:MAG: hypothetical protein CEE44_02295 [Candidatus Woesearchaeota archaeon B3_Woes]
MSKWKIKKNFNNNKTIMQKIILTYKKKLIKHIVNQYKKNNPKILDVGCGMGDSLKFCENYSNKLYGIDISKSRINYASKKVKAQFKVGYITKLPYQSNFFDIVIIMRTLQHIIDNNHRKKVISEIFRVTKKGGIILIDEECMTLLNYFKFFFINNNFIRYINIKETKNIFSNLGADDVDIKIDKNLNFIFFLKQIIYIITFPFVFYKGKNKAIELSNKFVFIFVRFSNWCNAYKLFPSIFCSWKSLIIKK